MIYYKIFAWCCCFGLCNLWIIGYITAVVLIDDRKMIPISCPIECNINFNGSHCYDILSQQIVCESMECNVGSIGCQFDEENGCLMTECYDDNSAAALGIKIYRNIFILIVVGFTVFMCAFTSYMLRELLKN